MAKTLDNCRLIGLHGAAVINGRCEGVEVSYVDDEPPDECKRCRFLYSNIDDKKIYKNDKAKGE